MSLIQLLIYPNNRNAFRRKAQGLHEHQTKMTETILDCKCGGQARKEAKYSKSFRCADCNKVGSEKDFVEV